MPWKFARTITSWEHVTLFLLSNTYNASIAVHSKVQVLYVVLQVLLQIEDSTVCQVVQTGPTSTVYVYTY